MSLRDVLLFGVIGAAGFAAYEYLNTQVSTAVAPGGTPDPSTTAAVQPTYNTVQTWISPPVNYMAVPQPTFQNSNDIDTLGRTIYGEARGETDVEKDGVASVVMNRFHNGMFGSTVASVCRMQNQFSCWNKNDPNYRIITTAQPSNPNFAHCLQIAREAISGQIPDNTFGATYYHDTSIPKPSHGVWPSLVETTQIGRLIFYRPMGVPSVS